MEPPPSLSGKLRELFLKQEEERFKLRARQLVEREKLVLTVEQVKRILILISSKKSKLEPLPQDSNDFLNQIWWEIMHNSSRFHHSLRPF